MYHRPVVHAICLKVTPRASAGGAASAGAAAAPARYRFEQAEVLVGRSEAVEVRLPHPAVSQVHARVRRQRGALLIFDAASSNGTWVDGRRVEGDEPAQLRPGSRVVVGPFLIEVLDQRLGLEVSPTGASDTASFARQMLLQQALGPVDASGGVLEVVEGPNRGLRRALGAGEVIVGREVDCDVALTDSDCSRHHVALRCEGQRVTARDLGSKNGSRLERRRRPPGALSEDERELHSGDEIVLGQTRLRYLDRVDAQLSELAAAEDMPLTPDVLADLLADDAPPAGASAEGGAAEAADDADSIGSGAHQFSGVGVEAPADAGSAAGDGEASTDIGGEEAAEGSMDAADVSASFASDHSGSRLVPAPPMTRQPTAPAGGSDALTWGLIVLVVLGVAAAVLYLVL